MSTLRAEPSLALRPGPWEHRMVAANGARFHVAEMGEGPMVVLLHGFPQFWWAWRVVLPALAEAGYRAVAMDLRGYGASDKPPRGYDPFTLTGDVAGVVRSLGAQQVDVVGHGLGGMLAWSMPVLAGDMVRSVAVLSAAHPRAQRAVLPREATALASCLRALPLQLPLLPERRLRRDSGAAVVAMLREWSQLDWADSQAPAVFGEAFTIPAVAHCALEFHRWAFRSLPRTDGRRYAAVMATPMSVPVLQLHGARDPLVAPELAGGARYVSADYRWRLLEQVGHFPHEEAPSRVIAELLDFLGSR